MEFKEYGQRAKLTESVIPAVKADPNAFTFVLKAFIASGNLLDMIKKNAIYRDYTDGVETIRKPYDQKAWSRELERLQRAGEQLQAYASDVSKFRDHVITSNPTDIRVLHSIIGIATESTEMVEALSTSYKTDEAVDPINFQEELGDLAWYQAIGVDAVNAHWGKILDTNIAKLECRNKGKTFNATATVDRDTVAERRLLEQGDARTTTDNHA